MSYLSQNSLRDKYELNYSKYAPVSATRKKNFFALFGQNPIQESIEDANIAALKNKAKAEKQKRKRIQKIEKAQREQRERQANKPRRKRTPVFVATLTGLLWSVVILLALTGLYGFYCYSRGFHGDGNVRVSTAIYCLSVMMGSFWAGAVVKRRSWKPCVIICAVYMLLSLIVSLRLFELGEFRLKYIAMKLFMTFFASALGFVLSLIPYLIGKSLKKQRKRQEERMLARRQREQIRRNSASSGR
jgi:putative membrane protein (TIGR04086 family)